MARQIVCLVAILLGLLGGRFAVCAQLASEEAALTPEALAAVPTDVKGFFGEDFFREMYGNTGRVDVLGKWNPNGDGPDILYRLPDGRLEIHEVKTYKEWPGSESMWTKLDGKPMQQLSDDWVKAWIARVEKDGTEVQRKIASEVKDTLAKGRVVRIFDEMKLSTGEFRTSSASAKANAEVNLEARAGPTKIDRFWRRFQESRETLAGLKADTKNARAVLLNRPKILELNASPQKFGDYSKMLADSDYKGVRVMPGLLLADGKLVVAVMTGAEATFFVFAVGGGVASYQYLAGEITRPEFIKDLEDAAVKGVAVGGAVAVAVVLGSNPAGWVVMGVGMGAYFVADAGLRTWHEVRDRRFVTEADLKPFGINVRGILDVPSQITTPLDIQEAGRPMTPLDIERTRPKTSLDR